MIDEKELINFKKKLGELIEHVDNICITTHLSPDIDAIVSTLIMKEVLKPYKKQIRIIVDKNIKCNYRFLKNIDQIEFGRIGDINKQSTLLVVTDVNQYSRISKVANTFDGFMYKVCIDHHETEADKFDLYIRKNTSSVVELLYIMFEKELVVNEDFAYNIYAAMIDDNGGFLYGVTEETLYTAYKLARFNIDLKEIHKSLLALDERSFHVARIMISNYVEHNRLGVFFINEEEAEDFNFINFGKARELLCKKIINYIDKVTWFVIIYPLPDGKSKARIISSNPSIINANKIAQAYKGGGHDTSAGMTYEGNVKSFVKKLFEIEDSINIK